MRVYLKVNGKAEFFIMVIMCLCCIQVWINWASWTWPLRWFVYCHFLCSIIIRQDSHLFSRSPIFALTFSSPLTQTQDSQTSGNSLAALQNTYLGAIPHIPPPYPTSQPLSSSRLASISILSSILLASHFTSITLGQSSHGETPLTGIYTRKIP